MLALIDADLLVYSIGYITNEDGTQRHWPTVASNLDQSIHNIVDECGADDHRLYLTSDDRSNFRISTATIKPYKGNRKSEKPHYYSRIRQYLEHDRGATVVRFWEADDQLGIDQCTACEKHVALSRAQSNDWDTRNDDKHRKSSSTVICTLDKDLDMIPGWHYNWKSKEKYYVEELEGLRSFYCQLLTGDTVDNILGLFGVGGKSKHLATIRKCTTEIDMFQVVREMYEKYYGSYWQQFLLENAKLLWILRTEVKNGCHPEEEVTRRLGDMILESIALDSKSVSEEY